MRINCETSLEPLPSWLLQVATNVTPEDVAWQFDEAVFGQGEECGSVETYKLGCSLDTETGEFNYPDYGDGKGSCVETCDPWSEFCLFQTVSTIKCSVFDAKNNSEGVLARAKRKLIRHERFAVEATFAGSDSNCCEGEPGDPNGPCEDYTPHTIECALSAQAELICPDECIDLCGAVSELETALFCCTETPIIHIPAGAINYMMDFLYKDENGLLRTCLGSYVVPGVGYDGSFPFDDEQCLGTGVMYGTGQVKYLQGEICYSPDSTDIADQADTLQNSVTVHAERAWGFWTDPCCGVKGVQVNYCKP